MRFVRHATYVSDYKLLIAFEDGSNRLVDLAPQLEGEMFEPLKDVDFFKRFAVSQDLDTVVWENDADFSPDLLYEIGKPVA